MLSGRTSSIITAALSLLLALGMHLAPSSRAHAADAANGRIAITADDSLSNPAI
jgi:hypothetical protein